ncbi:hypothetical protein STVA_38890 [Allostella vacuolata]|nr:hypothetical protein STVA_38890 [Stella vacuolata]
MTGSLDEAGYGRDGFGIVRGLVPPAQVAELAAAVEEVQARVAALPAELARRLTLERDLTADRRGGIPADAVGDAIFILGDPPAFDARFRAPLLLPGLAAAARQALGSDDLVAHFMNVTIKHPLFGRGVPWHRDFPNRYACPDGPGFVRLMVCLDGMARDAGATAFVPGSHRIDDGAAIASGGRSPPPPDATIAYAECDPGDVVVIHPKVLHGGFTNPSPRPRRNLVIQLGSARLPLTTVPEEETVAGWRLPA